MHRSPRPVPRALRALTSTLTAATLTLALLTGAVPGAYAARVFVDAGHGGRYPGATAAGIREANLNLAISLALQEELAARGHSVGMSRTTDTHLAFADRPTWSGTAHNRSFRADGVLQLSDDLQARCDAANSFGADVFISIHCDSFTNSAARGTATYWYPYSETDRILSKQLADHVQSGMITSLSPHYSIENDGVKQLALYVVHWSNMPSILVESAFLSNTYERGLLSDPTFRRRLAAGVAEGIDSFLATDPFYRVWPRVDGSDRYDTAARLALGAKPSGAQTVLLASGTAWPDALAATPLATKLDAPLLLTAPGRLPAATRDALAALSPTEIVVLGGPRAISETATAEAAAAAGIAPGSVRRIAGADRYETAAAIAEEVGTGSGTVAVVSGAAYPDAVSASAWAGRVKAPILLTRQSALPAPVDAFLAAERDSISSAVIVGGTAVVGAEVAAELSAYATTARVAGPDRYQTNLALVQRYWPSGKMGMLVATALDYPDALCAGVAAARSGQAVVLMGGRYLHPKTREFLENNESRFTTITMIGGDNALPPVTDWMIRKSLAR